MEKRNLLMGSDNGNDSTLMQAVEQRLFSEVAENAPLDTMRKEAEDEAIKILSDRRKALRKLIREREGLALASAKKEENAKKEEKYQNLCKLIESEGKKLGVITDPEALAELRKKLHKKAKIYVKKSILRHKISETIQNGPYYD
jgi:hypothetical protein